jgi:hypothetical protein
MRTVKAAVLCLAIAAVFVSCSSGPAPPKPGTHEWYWNAAVEQFTRGDLAKSQEHLEKLMATDNPYKKRAATWHLVVLAGLAEGHKELAEAYDAGAIMSKTQGADFRRLVQELRRAARMYSLGLAQEVERLQKDTAEAAQFTLEFPFPRGSATEVITLDRVRKGMLPQESERGTAEQRTLERAVLLETAAVVGAGQDTAKAAELFKQQPVAVPRAVFLLGLATSLFEQSALFDRKKMNEPDKKKILLEMAASCLKSAGEGDAAWKKKAKELQAKIEKERKALPAGV